MGNAEVTLNARVNPEGKATTYHFDDITKEHFQENGNSFSGRHPATSTPESASIGSDFILHKTSAQEASAQVKVVPETKYLCRVVATNADAPPKGISGPEGEFETPPALEIKDTWTFEVESKTASLNAEVNPLGIAATGFFEYVDDTTFQHDIAELGPGHGFDHAKKAPEGEEVKFALAKRR